MKRFCLSSLTEIVLAITGVVLIGHFTTSAVYNAQAADNAVSTFLHSSGLQSSLNNAIPEHSPSTQTDTSKVLKGEVPPPQPDQSLWSDSAKKKFASLSVDENPIAVISIPKFALQVPVYMGTSDEVLDRGAGWVEYTADPLGQGNVGIAGHRDSWFRPLKDIEIGDRLILHTLEGAEEFQVTKLQIVSPSQTDVLRDTREKTITLVTCYPFYYVGSAPERFVVRAQYLDQPKSGD